MIMGSLQNHASKVEITDKKGDYCPCLGTTDLGLPKVLMTYVQENNGSNRKFPSGSRRDLHGKGSVRKGTV